MKTFLLIFLFVGGSDRGPPPIEIPSLKECQAEAQLALKKEPPAEVERVLVGCVQERVAKVPL